MKLILPIRGSIDTYLGSVSLWDYEEAIKQKVCNRLEDLTDDGLYNIIEDLVCGDFWMKKEERTLFHNFLRFLIIEPIGLINIVRKKEIKLVEEDCIEFNKNCDMLVRLYVEFYRLRRPLKNTIVDVLQPLTFKRIKKKLNKK